MSAPFAARLVLMTDIALQCDIIGIDDAYLFNDVVSWCDNMANVGKVLIVAFRDETLQFGMVLTTEEVAKLRAVLLEHRLCARSGI